MKKLPFILLLALIACADKPRFADQTLIRIYDLKDRRVTDSLLLYLRSENPVYRREAALAFGSVQDSTASPMLGNALLEDTDTEVRRNAAFALGQTGGIQAVNSLIPAIDDTERVVVREVLEALGKTVTIEDLRVLADIKTTDTLIQEGQAWGLYRLALRNVVDSITTKAAANFLESSNTFQSRLAAAHYFGRATTVPSTGFDDLLANAATKDNRAEIRMAATAGIKHLTAARALPMLATILGSDGDYRVRVNAVRACQTFIDSAQAKSLILASLNDGNYMVQIATSEVVRRNAEKFTLVDITAPLAQASSMRVKANLFASALKISPDNSIVIEIEKNFHLVDSYGKAFLISALGEAKAPAFRLAFDIISAEMLNTANDKVIQTSAAAALTSLNKNVDKDIPAAKFLEMYKKGIAKGDPGVIGTICSALTNEAFHYKDLVKDPGFLYEAKSGLKLPKDIESLEPLERAIAFLEGKKEPKSTKNEFNHPIDWKFVSKIEPDQKVEIKTVKGIIVIRLLVNESPGSVANFVELVNKKYFDGRFFHRVVPNFVIQDGCNRGDGFGSEDYSIRSELSLRRYREGAVGMASAGKDTEGTQWFITHSPTPHLDGRYTIFAEVESGLDVVHQIEVGDMIIQMNLK